MRVDLFVFCLFDDELNEHKNFLKHTVEIRYNGLEGTREFWLLNSNVVKLNYQFLVFFHKQIKAKSKRHAYMLD